MANIATIGFFIGSLAFLALTALLATSWRGREEGGALLVASLAWDISGTIVRTGEVRWARPLVR